MQLVRDPAVRADRVVIRAERLVREFRTYRRRPGLRGAVTGLFHREEITVRAVDDVSFTVERGEIVGYLGPNGAGKSTTLKMLTGILYPTAGRVAVGGVVPYLHRRANAQAVGAVFGQRSQLWWDLPAIESLRILAGMYRVPAATYRENLALFDRVLELDAFMERPVRQLSLGQRMRVDLAAALLHNPAVLYLDEPTIGMDPVVKDQVRRFLRGLADERGTTVVLATHDLRDVEQLCGRVLVIDRGRLVYEGGVPALKRTYGRERTLVVQLADEEDENAAESGERGAPAVEGARLAEWKGGRARYVLGAAQNPQPVIARIAAQRTIADLTLEEPSLEDIIRELYRGGAAPDGLRTGSAP